jgi:hypothetical protein
VSTVTNPPRACGKQAQGGEAGTEALRNPGGEQSEEAAGQDDGQLGEVQEGYGNTAAQQQIVPVVQQRVKEPPIRSASAF